MSTLTDTSPFPFGTHKGKPMANVPASYLDWLRDQSWLDDWPSVRDYIEKNGSLIDAELEEQGRI